MREIAMRAQCMSGLAKDARSLSARMEELVKACKTNASKKLAKRRMVDEEVVAEQACTERTEHTDRIAQFEGDLHELKSQLDILECRNIVANSWYYMQSDECDSLKDQTASGRV